MISQQVQFHVSLQVAARHDKWVWLCAYLLHIVWIYLHGTIYSVYKSGVARKKLDYSTITIDNAAQYNNKGEWLYVSLQTWIYAPLQTDKLVWLHVCLQKVSGHGSQKKL